MTQTTQATTGPSAELVDRALALELPRNVANAPTVRDYLTQLLLKVWKEEEDFDGKRPFGNSGWQRELSSALSDAGLLAAEPGQEGAPVDERVNSLILAAIRSMGRPAPARPELAPDDGDGQWLAIAFMGHVELTGYVTEITLGGQPAFHVDLPEKLWGGNPMAWQEYAGSALYSRRPVTEESIRAAWEAQRARAARVAREEAEWQLAQQQRELEAGEDDESQEEPF